MEKPRLYTVIGLMSGTSLDGVDAAMIRTDGKDRVERVGFYAAPYDADLRRDLRACLGLNRDQDGRIARAATQMTKVHIDAVNALRAAHPGPVDFIGFHGQTIFHDPANKFTWQIGDAALLARETGVDVIHDFRKADVEAGGQGAPFLPLYHVALTKDLPKPVVILNLGGVGNVTYIGADGVPLAFDTGPANALIDDWVAGHTDMTCDIGGKIAASGVVHKDVVVTYLSHPYFKKTPPKSLDRDQWSVDLVRGLSLEDGAATLSDFTVQAVVQAASYFPVPPVSWYVTGGGRHNTTLMNGLRAALGVAVGCVDDKGWDGDAMEAEGFAYLAVRSALGLPLSLPSTTGVPHPLSGGLLCRAC